MSQETSVPRGTLVRGSILGTAVARASAKKAGQVLARPFQSKRVRASAKRKTDEQVAKVLFDACSVLRGTPLKLAQVLATERELLPETYREQFSLASHQVDPINRALVRKLLRVELGDPSTLFQSFEDVPFAAASLGQVHAATAPSGDALAVKVQYPGVDVGVASDLKLVKALLGPTQFGPLFEACLGELRERLSEELDYRCEATHTAWFREYLHIRDIVVPRVYHEYTTKHILATERLAGVHVAEYVATNPTQRERDRYGQLLTDLFHHSVFELKRIHADPNFGNYLFRNDGTLGLIDFGCVRQLDDRFVAGLRRFFAQRTFDSDTIEQLHSALGATYRSNIPKHELCDFLVRWGHWLLEPYRSETFDYARNTEYFARGFAMGNEARNFLGKHEGAFLYFGRTHHGLTRLLQTLGATVRLRIPDIA